MDACTEEDLFSAALEIVNLGVHGGQLDPFDPMAQVLVAGANVILAVRDANLQPQDVFDLIRKNARPEEPVE